MDDAPLNDILTPEPEPQAETPEQRETRERDERGRFVAKDPGETAEVVTTEEPSEPPSREPERVPITALHDERSKRQQAEERLRQYDEYFARLQANEQPPEAPSVFDDPEGHQAYVIEQAVAKALEKLTPAIQHGQSLSRAEVSEMLARQKYEDYDQKIEVFKEAVKDNPFLVQQVRNAPDPATFAYNAATKYQEAKQYGAAPSREAIEAEIRAQVMAELGLSRPQVPTTLADSRSVGSRTGPAWSPSSFSDIIK